MSCLKGPPGPNRKFSEVGRKFPNHDVLAGRKFPNNDAFADRKFPPSDVLPNDILPNRKFPPNDLLLANRNFNEANRMFPPSDAFADRKFPPSDVLLANRNFSEANRKFPPSDVLANRKFPPNDRKFPPNDVLPNDILPNRKFPTNDVLPNRKFPTNDLLANRKFNEANDVLPNRKFPPNDLLLANRNFNEANRKFPPSDLLPNRKFPPELRRKFPPGHEVIANEGVAKPLDSNPPPPPPVFYPATGAEVIANQYALPASPPGESLECPTCGHAYNSAHKRPRLLSCLHSVCEECLQILYQSCPKYKFISCPSCQRETVLFTDYGLAALAVNTRLLARLPQAEPANRNPPPWGAGESERGCYQSFRQYCGAACNCRVRNPVGACVVM